MRVDFNSDMGESYGRYTLGEDAEIMRYVTSINVACGWHAGDPAVMRQTVAAAKAAGVRVGAHPSYPDRLGFGRREMALTRQEARDYTLYQLGALHAFAAAQGTRLQHVKAHGAFYKVAVRDREIALGIAEAMAEFDPHLIMVGLPDSELLRAARQVGLPVAREGFADRAYNEDGGLVSRALAGAVIHDGEAVVARVLAMVQGKVTAITGKIIPITVETICLHGDTPGAGALARRIRQALEAAAVQVVPLESLVA
ncbi:MAG: LamB/YcsF family protein [candidate division NC10 bacterium]|nr:LamB/YcsF family protein [candidate division NC10 bacterium]